jgi:hypothetical protein
MSVCEYIPISNLARFKEAFVRLFKANVVFDRNTPTTKFTTITIPVTPTPANYGRNYCRVYVYEDNDNPACFRHGYDSDVAKYCLDAVMIDLKF